MKVLLSVFGVLCLLITTTSAVAIPTNATIMLDNPLSSDALTKRLDFEEETFPYSLEYCMPTEHQDIGLNAHVCDCWFTGYRSWRAQMVRAIDYICDNLNSSVRLGPGSIPSYTFTYSTTKGTTWDEWYDITAKVVWAGKALGNEDCCKAKAEETQGYQLNFDACEDNFKGIMDYCSPDDENNKQGAYGADKCLIYLIDPNDRVTGE